jgi:hypothetical protein
VNSVPFKIRYLLGNLARVEGVARLEADALILEFRTVDGLVGVFRSRPKEVRIHLNDIESVDFRRGWITGRLRIGTRRVSALEAIPGAKGAEINLKCRRRHRLAAEELASSLRLRVTEKHLEELRVSKMDAPNSTSAAGQDGAAFAGERQRSMDEGT